MKSTLGRMADFRATLEEIVKSKNSKFDLNSHLSIRNINEQRQASQTQVSNTNLNLRRLNSPIGDLSPR